MIHSIITNYGFVVFVAASPQAGSIRKPSPSLRKLWAFRTPHVAQRLWHNVGDALPLRVAQCDAFEDSSTPWWEMDKKWWMDVNGGPTCSEQILWNDAMRWYFKVVQSWAIPKWKGKLNMFHINRYNSTKNQHVIPSTLWTQTWMLPRFFQWMVHLNMFASASCNHRRCSCNCHNLGKPGWTMRRNHSFSSCQHNGDEAMTI